MSHKNYHTRGFPLLDGEGQETPSTPPEALHHIPTIPAKGQKRKILFILAEAWTYGTPVPNHQLNKQVGFRYSARIHELRRAGWSIATKNEHTEGGKAPSVSYRLRDKRQAQTILQRRKMNDSDY